MNIRNDLTNKFLCISGIPASDYLGDLKMQGVKVFISKNNTPWIQSERISMIRYPIFNFEYPGMDEISEVLHEKGILLASFVIRASETKPSNAVLYICTDKEYNINKLSSPVQRNIKKAQKELNIKQVSPGEFLQNGVDIFCNTRERAGLNDGTAGHFHRKFSKISEFKTYKIWGAFFGEKLIAFAIINETECWAELNLYSATDYLSYRPNDYLVYYVLNHYLVEKQYEFVSYGFSTIQLNTSKEGLHRFKLKIGFQAIPVRRVFIMNKRFRFLKSSFFRGIFKIIVQINPKSRRIKKIEGALELIED